jgi:glycosyltransferase involved in cell wall biosynthesis
MTPCVSVVLPVYNVAPYIEATIASILAQTFEDFELLVLDDCSTDETVAKVQAIKDPRLRLVQNPRNIGRAGTDNAALAYVQGQYIAKMDGDDLCHPERLARQVAFLRQHPDVNVVGCWMQNFGASTYLNQYPEHPDDARVLTLFTLPTGNPSMMMRTSLFRQQAMHYDASLRQTEDYDFCARYIQQLRIATIQAPLLEYRVPTQTTKKLILSERATVSDVVREQLLRDWGINFVTRELQVHNTIAMLERPLTGMLLEEVEAWLNKILSFNDINPLFETKALQKGLGKRWFEVCYTYPQPFFGNLRHFSKSPLAAYYPLTAKQRLKMLTKGIRRLF